MEITITIIIGLVVLSVIVLVHELGHFVTAKATGVKVEEFGMGYPPRILGIRRGETLYSLNAIPFGGFNKLSGEEDPTVPRSLASKSIGTRLLVISAGSLMNAVLAFLLFSIAFMIPHNVVHEPVIVKVVAPNSPAATAGIQPGDTLLSINGEPVQNLYELLRSVQMNLGEEITLLIEHSDSTTEDVKVIPRWKPPEDEGAIGIEIDLEAVQQNRTTIRQSYPFWQAIPMGASELIDTLILYKDGMVSLVVGTSSAEVAGPVGLVQIMGETAKFGISPLLELAAIFSLIIGIINLFPIPALDGGRIAFILLEFVRRGKRIPPKTEGMVHLIGFILLISVMLAITYRDIIRIISGESPIP
ncbi:RIP metalloprotease RseP [Chloroflexota bacterium]